MLKRRVDDQLWLITQPDHAAVSGYLAAHWGNGEFARPGYYAASPNPEQLRAETILGIAEHDNGWWEWEADPQLDPGDGLPLHLTDLSQQDGFERWRLGVPRFERDHPYVSLLISLHAYWLHAPRLDSNGGSPFRHPLFGLGGSWLSPEGPELEEARRFVAEQESVQERLTSRLRQDPAWTAAVEPENLHPHARLLQLGDALSLSLCFGAKGRHQMEDVPRKSWEDRVALEVSPVGKQSVQVHPYPFDQDPLPVALRARVLTARPPKSGSFQGWWHRVPRTFLRFEYCSAA